MANAEIPGGDHGIGAADQIVHWQHADTAIAAGPAAVGGVVPFIAHHKQVVWRYSSLRRVVEPAVIAQFENLVANTIGQSLDVAIRRFGPAIVVFGLSDAIG